jgi:hypothetical protein
MKNLMNYSLATEPFSPSARQSSQSVRRLIRSLKSCQYFRDGQWTADPNLADHFPDAGKVVEACVRYHLVDVELVLQRAGEASGIFDMHLRLLDQPASTSTGPMPAAA